MAVLKIRDENGRVVEIASLPGRKGDDGFSPVAAVEEVEGGAVITITDKNGTTTATVTNGKNGEKGAAGKDGKDGHTPVLGVDYWTEIDKNEIIRSVLDAMGACIGIVGDDNTITLTGDLVDGTYNIKYEMEDGSNIDIGELTLGTSEPAYTNLFVVGGDGYVLNGRASSSGADRADTNGCVLSNYISVKNGDVVYIKNATIRQDDVRYSGMKLADGSTVGLKPNASEYITNYSEANGITQFTINKADAAYIRVCFDIDYGTALTNDDVSSKGIIITVNEPLS
jgi:hypothetical protein